MREIKFRIWHKKSVPQKMLYWGKDFFSLMCKIFKGTHGFPDTIDIRAENSPGNRHFSLTPHDFVLMQYTGLKDKNGKEIWQSDFIKGHGAGFSTTHSEVHFTHDGAQIEIGDHWIQLSKFTEIEIIGHKYEQARKNPQKN